MKRAALAGIALSTGVIALAYALSFGFDVAPILPPALLAVGTSSIIASAFALGAQRAGRLGLLWIPVATVPLVVGGGLLALLLAPPVDHAVPALVGGLPPRAAFLLYGVGLLPIFVVPVAYALSFERMNLSDEDLERVRRAATPPPRGADGEEGPGGSPGGPR